MMQRITGLFLACSAATPLAAPSGPAEPPPFGVRGKIEKVTPAAAEQKEKGLLGHVLVAGKKEADTETDRAVAIVTRGTRLLGPGKARRTWKDLKPGQRVEVRFKPGPRILIYPTRAEATELRILEK